MRGNAMRVTRALPVLLALAGPALADGPYEAPAGCQPVATVRLPDCLVRQVAICETGSISDYYHEGGYVGRVSYGHPAMAVRFDLPGGIVIEHRYGAGAPSGGERPAKGVVYSYSHEVVRSTGEVQKGDRGTEEMTVGETYAMAIGGRDVTVTEIGFAMTVPEDDYVYRERAILLADPLVMIGRIGATYDLAGNALGVSGGLPASISLPGEPGFLGMDPVEGCYQQ